MKEDTTSIVDKVNQRTMSSPDAVQTYVDYTKITAAERAIFEQLHDEVRGSPILDLGVGAGRTVNLLRDLSKNYIGIDYTPEMLEVCRRRFPDVDFQLSDARNLSSFAEEQFKLVVFSCNGLCMVNHADRLRILREVHRVLAPDGFFVFSTHNQNSREHSDGMVLPPFRKTWNPARLLVRSLRFLRDTALRIRNHRSLARYDYRGADYSVINDRCHHYSTMLYYISLRNQREQLVDAGFLPDAPAYDAKGSRITDDTTDNSITIIARKQ